MAPDKFTTPYHGHFSMPVNWLFLFFLAVAHLAVWPGAAAQPAPVLSACEVDYPPFCFVNEGGQVDGFSVELLRASLKAMGREATFQTGDWAEVRELLENGEIDALPLVGRTPEREEIFDFTIPYMTLRGVIVTRADTTDIQAIGDLRGRRVAVMAKDNAEEFLRRLDRGIDIHTTPTFEVALRDLSAGRFDAVVMQRLVALRLISETGLSNLRLADKPLDEFRQEFCFAVREGDRDTLALLNEGLAIVMADGTHRYLHSKWFAALQIPDDRRIVVGGDHNYPPYEFLDKSGHPTGFTVELTRAIAREMGLEIEFRLGPWADVVNQLESGEIDIIQGMFYSTERDLKFDFTQPHLVNHYVSAVRRGEGAPPDNLEELRGKRIVAQRGDVIVDYLMEHGLGGQLMLVETHEDMLRELAEGRHDCALVVRISALYLIDKNGWSNLSLGRHSFISMDYCYVAMSDHDALLAQFGEGLRVLEESGEYRRIYDKWLGVYKEKPPSLVTALQYSAIVLVPLLLVLLGGVLWSWSLRRQVRLKTKELRESLGRFQFVFEAANAGKSLTLPSGEINPNKALANMLGYAPDEVKGLRWHDVIPPEEMESTLAKFKPLYDGEMDSARFEQRYVRKDGSIIWTDLSVSIHRDEAGKPQYLVSTLVDISERKRAEDALHERIKELQCLYRVAEVSETPDISINALLERTVNLLPAGWQFPAITAARIEFDSQVFMTPNYQDTVWRLEAEIRVHNAPAGIVQVNYLEEKPDSDEGPFLREERRLINEIAKRMGETIERRSAEDALRLNQKMLARTEQIANIGSWEWDVDKDQVSWSEGMYRILGFKPGDKVPSFAEHSRFLVAEDMERLREAVNRCIATGEPYELELRHIMPNGETRYCLAYGQSDLAGPGPVRRLFGFLQDVTDRKQAEEALRAHEEFQRAMIACSPVALYSLDKNGLVESWNSSAERIFGWTADEVIGNPLPIVPEDKQEEFAILRGQVLNNEGFTGLELGRLRKDGALIPISLSVAPIRNKQGEIVGIMGAAEDISERRRAQEERERLKDQLAQSHKLESVGRLAGGVAHDFNNILQAMMGYGELLMDDLPEGGVAREYVKEISQGVERATTLTRQLLAFARKQTVSPRALDLNATVENMLKMLRRLIGEDIDLVWRPAANVWAVKIDPGQLDQILANLCVNARDAISGVGKVTIETGNVIFDEEYCADHAGFAPGEYVLLAVSDDGCGMNREMLEMVFEPFFTTKGMSHGTGLGLATVYGIVKQNEGFINVYSEVGEGSTFRIYLPRHEGEAKSAIALESAQLQRGEGEQLLLVEDDESIKTLGQRMLEGLGYRVLASSSPIEALTLARAHKGCIDLLITDVVMPGMNGRQLAGELQAMYPSIKTLYMSGYTANVIAHHGVLEEGVHFLQKPFSMSDMAGKVREALEQ